MNEVFSVKDTFFGLLTEESSETTGDFCRRFSGTTAYLFSGEHLREKDKGDLLFLAQKIYEALETGRENALPDASDFSEEESRAAAFLQEIYDTKTESFLIPKFLDNPAKLLIECVLSVIFHPEYPSFDTPESKYEAVLLLSALCFRAEEK